MPADGDLGRAAGDADQGDLALGAGAATSGWWPSRRRRRRRSTRWPRMVSRSTDRLAGRRSRRTRWPPRPRPALTSGRNGSLARPGGVRRRRQRRRQGRSAGAWSWSGAAAVVPPVGQSAPPRSPPSSGRTTSSPTISRSTAGQRGHQQQQLPGPPAVTCGWVAMAAVTSPARPGRPWSLALPACSDDAAGLLQLEHGQDRCFRMSSSAAVRGVACVAARRVAGGGPPEPLVRLTDSGSSTDRGGPMRPRVGPLTRFSSRTRKSWISK